MTTNIKRGIALLSSGLDSSVASMLAHTYDCDLVMALTYDYGQRAAAREIRQARRVAEHLGVPHRVLELPWFREFQGGGDLLKGQNVLPHPTLKDLSLPEFTTASAKAVWVPNRNGVFLEIAAGIAEDMGAQVVVVGFNKEEAATFPDNTVEYLIALSYALSYSTSNRVQVLSPTARMDKTEIVEQAIQNDFPLDLVWSCYEDQERMCGKCESCMRLKRALAANKVTYEPWFENAVLQ